MDERTNPIAASPRQHRLSGVKGSEGEGEIAVLIVNRAIAMARTIADVLLSDFSDARFVTRSSATALAVLQRRAFDMTLIGTNMMDDVWYEQIPLILQSPAAGKTLFVIVHRDPGILRVVRSATQASAFDISAETGESFRRALQDILGGRRYVSPSLVTGLNAAELREIESMLTGEATRVLSVLGCGIDDREAAVVLRMTVGAVASWRKRLMHRFNLHQRSELSRFALRYGFTVETSDGRLRPGFV